MPEEPQLPPLTTTSGRPVHYGNAYLTQEEVRLQHRTPCLTKQAQPLPDWSEVERWLRVAVEAAA